VEIWSIVGLIFSEYSICLLKKGCGLTFDTATIGVVIRDKVEALHGRSTKDAGIRTREILYEIDGIYDGILCYRLRIRYF
jgi:hypothetical protein